MFSCFTVRTSDRNPKLNDPDVMLLRRAVRRRGEIMLFPSKVAVIFHRALEEFEAPVVKLRPCSRRSDICFSVSGWKLRRIFRF